MATLALGAAFSGLASSLGAAAVIAPVITGIGVAVGSFLDNAFILPALFPPPDIEGPRLSEIRTSFAEEGSPINFGYGSTVRTNGTVIWTSDLQEVKVEEEVGGKGGGQKVTRYEYLISMAVMFAEMNDGQTASVVEITGTGKPIYRVPQSIAYVGLANASATVTVQSQSHFDVTSANTSLGSFIAGGEVIISGFSNAANNGTFVIISATADAGAGTSRLRLRNSAAVSETGASVTITQQTDAFNDANVESVEIHQGSLVQLPSATIEAFEGVGNVPAWRGYAYVVLKNLNLTDFGNVPPQINITWKPGTTATAGGMVNDLTEKAGLGASWATIASSLSYPVDGYPLQGVVALSSAVQPIAIAANMLAQGREGALEFFARTGATIIDVDAADLSSHEIGSESRERPIQVQDANENEIAERVTVRYLDNQNRLQGGAQSARATTAGAPNTERTINLPLVLNDAAADAQEIAQRVLFDSFNRRETIRISLPPSYMHVQENDVLRIVALGRTWYLLVRKIDRGANYVLQLECTAEIRDSLVQVAASEAPLGGSVAFDTTNLVIVFYPSDTPGPGPGPGPGPIPNPNPGTPSIIIPFAHTDPNRSESLACLYSKRVYEADSEYREIGKLGVESTLGFATTALGFADITCNFEDVTNTVDVELWRGSMVSPADDARWRDGDLAVKIENEIVFVKTATLIGERTYRLSGLLRGMLGTGDGIGDHGIGDAVTVISSTGIRDSVIEIPWTWVGSSRSFKMVPLGRDVSEVEEVRLQIRNAGVTPQGPVDLVSNRDTNGDIALRWAWIPLTRYALFGDAPAPVFPMPELIFEVDIRVSEIVTYTQEVRGTNVIEILQSDLTAAGIATTDDVDCLVYQINPQLGGTGRGLASSAHTIGPSPVP